MDSLERWSSYAAAPSGAAGGMLRCLGAGEQGGRLPWFRDRRLNSHGLVYVSAGRGRYLQSGPLAADVEVVAPAVIWLFPGVQHGYGPDADGWDEHWILFADGLAAFESLGVLSRARPVVRLIREPDGIAALFSGLRVGFSDLGLRSDLETSVLTQRVLLALHDVDPRLARRDGSDLLARFIESAHHEIPMAERARRLGLSSRDLQITIRDATSLSPLDALIEVRLNRAQALLAESSRSVADVAREVGYRDPAYFSRLFARRMGIAPTRFRQQQRRIPPGSSPAGAE